uniref:RING-type domain-containing protein n=1 Tax=Taeniopygia guttata TaxID=59729 RepID=A0A674GKP0_TAEGU
MARGAAEALPDSGSAAPAATSGGQREAAAAGPCPICLGDVDNAAHVDTCLHTFCFACIRQWPLTPLPHRLQRRAQPALPGDLPSWGHGFRPSCARREHQRLSGERLSHSAFVYCT